MHAAIALPALIQLLAADSTPLAVMDQFKRITSPVVWPGFEPSTIPIAIYDGERTFLFRHPNPPEEFEAVEGRDDVWVVKGQHPSVRANTSTELRGVRTATVLLPREDRPVTELAALVLHEVFHVFQREHHPDWTANEVELFVYPVDDVLLAELRRRETAALRRALLSQPAAEAVCWAKTVVRIRDERFGRLPEGSVGYERGLELFEGLARYVQDRAAGTPTRIAAQGFPLEDVRERGYAVGQGLALLLDRFRPGWQDQLESGSATNLDELLGSALSSNPEKPCDLSLQELSTTVSRARADVEALERSRAAEKQQFMAQPGWAVVVMVEDGEPLWPQGFDPLNVRRLSDGEVLHTRWIKLGNAAGSLEVLDARALTVAAGSHPLFNGVSKIIIRGFDVAPQVTRSEGAVSIKAQGLTLEFTGAQVEQRDQSLILTLGN